MTKPLNILFLCSWYPSRVLPTNGDFIQRHAAAVATQHNVTVFHIITDKNCTQKIEIVDEVIQNIRTIIAYIKPTSNRFSKALMFRKAQQKLLEKVTKIDVVHVNKLFPMGLFALKLKRKFKLPYIISEHHHIYYKPFADAISYFEKRISIKITKNAHFVCPVSSDLGQSMQKFGLVGNYKPIGNVIDTITFKAKNTNEDKLFTMLHVSNLSAVKNTNGILNVIAKLKEFIPNFQLNIVGGDTVDINDDTIKYVGKVSQKELVNYYQQADVLLLFSHIETFSCVVYESFSCGTPVISTNVGGIPENFPNDFGILIEPKNEEALLEAILKIHKTTAKSSEKMHEYVEENFSKEQICNAFTKLYEKALSV